MLRSQARREFKSRLPHVAMVDIFRAKLWIHLDFVFHREGNLSVDRVALISWRHRYDKSLEQFHAALTGLAAKCQLAQLEDELVRDIYIANIRVTKTVLQEAASNQIKYQGKCRHTKEA